MCGNFPSQYSKTADFFKENSADNSLTTIKISLIKNDAVFPYYKSIKEERTMLIAINHGNKQIKLVRSEPYISGPDGKRGEALRRGCAKVSQLEKKGKKY